MGSSCCSALSFLTGVGHPKRHGRATSCAAGLARRRPERPPPQGRTRVRAVGAAAACRRTAAPARRRAGAAQLPMVASVTPRARSRRLISRRRTRCATETRPLVGGPNIRKDRPNDERTSCASMTNSSTTSALLCRTPLVQAAVEAGTEGATMNIGRDASFGARDWIRAARRVLLHQIGDLDALDAQSRRRSLTAFCSRDTSGWQADFVEPNHLGCARCAADRVGDRSSHGPVSASQAGRRLNSRRTAWNSH